MKLSQYRNDRNLSTQALADASGVSVRTIRDIENGRVDPRRVRVDTVIRLARILGVSTEELMGVYSSWPDGAIMYESDVFKPSSDNQ